MHMAKDARMLEDNLKMDRMAFTSSTTVCYVYTDGQCGLHVINLHVM